MSSSTLFPTIFGEMKYPSTDEKNQEILYGSDKVYAVQTREADKTAWTDLTGDINSFLCDYNTAMLKARSTDVEVRVVRVSRYMVDGKCIPVEVMFYKARTRA